MKMSADRYSEGIEAAYKEIYYAIESDDHPRNCGPCRACWLIRSVIEDTFLSVGSMLSPEDFTTMRNLMAKLNEPPGQVGGVE